MDLVEVIEQIEKTDMVKDNENLSIPYLFENNDEFEIRFFTYVTGLGMDNNLEYYISSRIICSVDETKIEEVNLNVADESGYDRIIPTAARPDRYVDYMEVVEQMQAAIMNDFDYEDVKRLAEFMNSYVAKELISFYRNEAETFFVFLESVLKRG